MWNNIKGIYKGVLIEREEDSYFWNRESEMRYIEEQLEEQNNDAYEKYMNVVEEEQAIGYKIYADILIENGKEIEEINKKKVFITTET